MLIIQILTVTKIGRYISTSLHDFDRNLKNEFGHALLHGTQIPKFKLTVSEIVKNDYSVSLSYIIEQNQFKFYNEESKVSYLYEAINAKAASCVDLIFKQMVDTLKNKSLKSEHNKILSLIENELGTYILSNSKQLLELLSLLTQHQDKQTICQIV